MQEMSACRSHGTDVPNAREHKDRQCALHGWKDGQVLPRDGGRHDGACLLLWQGKRGLRSVSRSDTNAWHSDLLGLVLSKAVLVIVIEELLRW